MTVDPSYLMPTNKGPTAHLTWHELRSRGDGRAYPLPWRTTRAVVIAQTFEHIRAIVCGPIVIGSAYRSPAHNRSIGGARDSMHMYGLALDLHTPAGVTVAELYDIADSVIPGVGAVFHYSWGCHVDRRDFLGRPAVRGAGPARSIDHV